MKVEDLEKTFINHKSTLKAVSYDDKNGVYMVNFETEVIDFDKVKEEYIKNLKLSDTPCSNDGLVLGHNGRIFFVEFKNGSLQRETFKLGKKIYDSVLIFTDITGISIGDMRKYIEYVMVYNENANSTFLSNALNQAHKQTNEEAEKITLANDLLKLGGEEIILCDLEKFQNYCFKAVHTYTVSEFEAYLNEG